MTDDAGRIPGADLGLKSLDDAAARTGRLVLSGSPDQTPRRLSRLSIWWLKLGIEPLVLEPGHPEQNGRHERMHRTLKAETARPPAASLSAQETVFDHFRSEYNHERPHEAIGQVPPAELYGKSPRSYPSYTPQVSYPGHFKVRRVKAKGEIRFRGALRQRCPRPRVDRPRGSRRRPVVRPVRVVLARPIR